MSLNLGNLKNNNNVEIIASFNKGNQCFFKRIIKSVILTTLLGSSGAIYAKTEAQADQGFSANWPQVNYNNTIPSVEAELGYKIGQRISSHADMLRYFEALQDAQPTRIKLFEYGESWEGRKLIYAVIGNEQNIANLTQFTRDMQALSDPRNIKSSKANSLIESLPGSVWLQYGVHGNEISSTDAAMMTAYHLLAGTGDASVDNIMENNLVFIDPLQNPDGRSRFIAHYYSTVGIMHSDDRLSAEHNEPWPNGRTNHYLFDLNRDWLPITQPETKGRIASINKYHPIVVVDLHEMRGDKSYYFAPSAQPVTPNLSQAQKDNIDTIGRNNAKHFDKNGIDYFTREIFDSFYPGYGVSWPTFTGAATSTYEVASASGEKFKRLNGTTFTYEDTVFKHFIASLSTAESVADNRQKYLRDYYQYQIDAIEAGKSDKKNEFIFCLTSATEQETLNWQN